MIRRGEMLFYEGLREPDCEIYTYFSLLLYTYILCHYP